MSKSKLVNITPPPVVTASAVSVSGVPTLLLSSASDECCSFGLKQFWHLALLKMFGSNFWHHDEEDVVAAMVVSVIIPLRWLSKWSSRHRISEPNDNKDPNVLTVWVCALQMTLHDHYDSRPHDSITHEMSWRLFILYPVEVVFGESQHPYMLQCLFIPTPTLGDRNALSGEPDNSAWPICTYTHCDPECV